METQIRNARPDDATVIADFNARMCEETEHRQLDAKVLGRGVARLLADATLGRYWIAERDGQVIGQIMVTYEWSDWRNGTIWWIQSVYVHPDARRQGIFSMLYRHVEALATQDSEVCGLRLYHERDNRNARATYEALGMSDPGYRVMETIFKRRK